MKAECTIYISKERWKYQEPICVDATPEQLTRTVFRVLPEQLEEWEKRKNES